MNWLPFGRETLVSALSKEELLDRLAAVTRGTRAEGHPELRPLFYGQVEEHGFRISRVIEKGDNFLPLLLGKVEDTPRGSILFLRYQLFSITRFFLWFWTGILLGFSLFFFLGSQQFLQGGVCLSLMGLNYALAVFFFYRQLLPSKKLFQEVINFPSSSLESSRKL
jgi:hypothetical protein